jgi:xylulokinase
VTTRTLAGSTAAAAERIAALAGPHDRLVVFGGGSRSPVWLRAKAAALGMPVVRGSAEAVARGAALVAGVAAGWWATPAAGPTPAPRFTAWVTENRGDPAEGSPPTPAGDPHRTEDPGPLGRSGGPPGTMGR